MGRAKGKHSRSACMGSAALAAFGLLGVAPTAQAQTAPQAAATPAATGTADIAAAIGLSPIHSNATPLARVFHLRSAMNVAALACSRQMGPSIVENYNQVLRTHKVTLLAAYTEMGKKYKKQGDFDRALTRLYNHFAWPPSQASFCREADDAIRAALTVPPAQFQAWAQNELADVDRPIGESLKSSLGFLPPKPATAP